MIDKYTGSPGSGKAYHSLDEFPKMVSERLDQIDKNAPYSLEDYKDAKKQGLDLDNWEHYEKYYGLGEEEDYS